MIERQMINGRGAMIVYLDQKFEPVEADDAELVKVIFDDGEVLLLTPAEPEAEDAVGTISKETADYVEPGPNPATHCVLCSMFEKPESCSLVRGDIAENGHCKHFAKDAADDDLPGEERQALEEAAEHDELGYLQGIRKVTLHPDVDQWNAMYQPEPDEIVLEGKFIGKDPIDKLQTILHEAGHRGQFRADPESFAEFRRRGLDRQEYFLDMANPTHLEDFARTGRVEGTRAAEIFAESYARWCLGIEMPQELRIFWNSRRPMGFGDAGFEESEHPRDATGKFSETSGGGAGEKKTERGHESRQVIQTFETMGRNTAKEKADKWLTDNGAVKREATVKKDVTLPGGEVLPDRTLRGTVYDLPDGRTVMLELQSATSNPAAPHGDLVSIKEAPDHFKKPPAEKPDIRKNMVRETGPSTQPVKSLDELYDRSKAEEQAFITMVEHIAAATGSEAKFHVDEKTGSILKPRESAERKLRDELDGDFTKIRDVLRGTVVADSVAKTRNAAATFIARQGPNILRVKDRHVGSGVQSSGYRDILVNFRTPDGLVAELQFNSKAMLEAKEEGHKIYDMLRRIPVGEQVGQQFSELEAKTRAMYDKAYQDDGDGDWGMTE